MNSQRGNARGGGSSRNRRRKFRRVATNSASVEPVADALALDWARDARCLAVRQHREALPVTFAHILPIFDQYCQNLCRRGTRNVRRFFGDPDLVRRMKKCILQLLDYRLMSAHYARSDEGSAFYSSCFESVELRAVRHPLPRVAVELVTQIGVVDVGGQEVYPIPGSDERFPAENQKLGARTWRSLAAAIEEWPPEGRQRTGAWGELMDWVDFNFGTLFTQIGPEDEAERPEVPSEAATKFFTSAWCLDCFRKLKDAATMLLGSPLRKEVVEFDPRAKGSYSMFVRMDRDPLMDKDSDVEAYTAMDIPDSAQMLGLVTQIGDDRRLARVTYYQVGHRSHRMAVYGNYDELLGRITNYHYDLDMDYDSSDDEFGR